MKINIINFNIFLYDIFLKSDSELLVPEEEIKVIMNRLGKEIVNTIIPYSQIYFESLSNEVNFPLNFTIAILKMLISERKIIGSLDMTNHILVIEQVSKIPRTQEKVEIQREQRISENQSEVSKPSGAWYLVPLFLGIIGGIIGYLAVKDEDKKMANNLLYLGLGVTFIGWIGIWVSYS